MRVLLIDADSTIPNLALMKISTFHKSQGDTVDLVRPGLPYYPTRKKHLFFAPGGYDKTYASIVYTGNREFILGFGEIIYGGTGVNLSTKLSPEIECLPCDYSLYPENDISYGFISRGCPRKCAFCVVHEKEGGIHQVNCVSSIIQHKKVRFLDNNILALPNHKDILRDLVDRGVKCQFCQGLDIRFVDIGNSNLLRGLNYLGNYTFAFDNWAYRKAISKKIVLLGWRKSYEMRFYVYVHPSMGIRDTVRRVEWLREEECLPFIMRDITCWQSPFRDFYTDISAYCNQPNIFKKMTFEEFLERRYEFNKERVVKSARLYRRNR